LGRNIEEFEKKDWIQINEKEMPFSWYNIQADLPEPLPPVLHPGTGKPVTPGDLAPLFSMELIKQEVSTESPNYDGNLGRKMHSKPKSGYKIRTSCANERS